MAFAPSGYLEKFAEGIRHGQRIKPTPTAGKLLAHIALSDSWCPRPELNRDMTFRKRLLYPFELRGLSWFPDMPWAMDWQIKNAR